MDGYIAKIAGRAKKGDDDESESEEESEEETEGKETSDTSAAEDALAAMCEYERGNYPDGGGKDPAREKIRSATRKKIAEAFADAIREIVGSK